MVRRPFQKNAWGGVTSPPPCRDEGLRTFKGCGVGVETGVEVGRSTVLAGIGAEVGKIMPTPTPMFCEQTITLLRVVIRFRPQENIEMPVSLEEKESTSTLVR